MPTTTSSERVVELPATAAAAGLARRELAATPGMGSDLGYRALLMASELVAVYVGGTEPGLGHTLTMAISVTTARLRVEVSGGPPEVSPATLMRSSDTPSLGGMGLQIVDRMADAWGVDDSAIWFELAR